MPKKKERIKQCFTLDKGFVKKLKGMSDKTGVPKSRIIERCFGNGDALGNLEKFCSSVNKQKKEGE